MDRKKFGASLVALVAGIALSAGGVWAQSTSSHYPTGYLMGDPAPGKLVPYFRAEGGIATIIGIESVEEDAVFGFSGGEDVSVHVTVFSTVSVELINFDLCLSPFDFGYVVLQEGALSAAQVADLAHVTGPHTLRFNKARVLSMGGLATEGYVTIRAIAEFNSNDGTCGAGLDEPVHHFFTDPPFDQVDHEPESEPLATWAILQDVTLGKFATEIPTPTANILSGVAAIPAPLKGQAVGGFGAFGLIPRDHAVIARYDVNPIVGAHTAIYVWLGGIESANKFPSARSASLECEDELSISTTINLSREVNVIDPDKLAGGHALDTCKLLGQFRGVLQFDMPSTGFLWSHISQDGQNYRENFLGYNLECNQFIVPSCPVGIVEE